jgi:predicted lipoprotein with Yx(FWY)xxD motif
MTSMMQRVAFAGLFTFGLAQAALAAGMLTDANGMTLYSFDKDTGGVSACYGDCATKWPPYLGKAGDAMTEGWTLVDRTDGTKQWAYDGKPMYFFAGDKAKGDHAGDGLGGVWHIISE